MTLRDLNTYIFRSDHTIYGFDSKKIIVHYEKDNESYDDDDESIISFVEEREDDMTVVMTSTIHNENEFYVGCEGICKCYYEEVDRRLSNLIYSHRFSSTLAISVLGLAVAKFVNDKIHECYEEARNHLIDSIDERLLTCSMEESQCSDDSILSDDRVNDQGDKVRKVYECKGHCINKKVGEAAQDAVKKMECEKNWIGPKRIELTEKDNVPFASRKRNTQIGVSVNRFYAYHPYAERKFQKLYLVPFCKSFRTSYKYYYGGGNKFENKYINPCCATIQRKKTNVECIAVQE